MTTEKPSCGTKHLTIVLMILALVASVVVGAIAYQDGKMTSCREELRTQDAAIETRVRSTENSMARVETKIDLLLERTQPAKKTLSLKSVSSDPVP